MGTERKAWHDTLAMLVVKRGVSLGGLPPRELSVALAMVWAGVPGAPLSERELNRVLVNQLAGVAAFLDTDHVELRRWLVDAGWLTRDGYGREYRRVEMAALAPQHSALAEALSALDLPAWVAALNQAQSTFREARRQAWQASQAGKNA